MAGGERTGRKFELYAFMSLLPQRFDRFGHSTVTGGGGSSHSIVEVITELQLPSKLNLAIWDRCRGIVRRLPEHHARSDLDVFNGSRHGPQ